MILKIRKKPVIVEAIIWDGTEAVRKTLFHWSGGDVDESVAYPGTLMIFTLEGTMQGSIGDYIIKGVKGEFYACKPDVLALTYDILPSDS